MGKNKTIPFVTDEIYQGLISGTIRGLKYKSANLTYSNGFFCMKSKRGHALYHQQSYNCAHLNGLWCAFSINEG